MITIEIDGVKRPMTHEDLPKVRAALYRRTEASKSGSIFNWQVVASVPFVVIGYLAHKIFQTIAIGLILGWTTSRDYDGEIEGRAKR